MKKQLFFAVVVMSAMMVSCNKQTTTVNEEITGAKTEDVSVIPLVKNLVQYGYRVQSAEALLMAADVMVSNPTSELIEFEITRESDGGGSNAQKEEKEMISVDKLVADALALGAEDPAITEFASKIQSKKESSAELAANTTRGRSVGSLTHRDRVEANCTDEYSLNFNGGEKAEVAVLGDGDTDLDLYVYDANGNLITKDDDLTDRCYVSFRPSAYGKFKIRIKNRGNVYNRYVLMTN